MYDYQVAPMSLSSSGDLVELFQNIGLEKLKIYSNIIELYQKDPNVNIDEEHSEIISMVKPHREKLIKYGWRTDTTQISESKKAMRDIVIRKYSLDFLNLVFEMVNNDLPYSEIAKDNPVKFGTLDQKTNSVDKKIIQLTANNKEFCSLVEEYVSSCVVYLKHGFNQRVPVVDEYQLSRLLGNDADSKIDHLSYPIGLIFPKDIDDKINQILKKYEEFFESCENFELYIADEIIEHSMEKEKLLIAKNIHSILNATEPLVSVYNRLICYVVSYTSNFPSHAFPSSRRWKRDEDIFSRPGEYGGERYGAQYYDDDW